MTFKFSRMDLIPFSTPSSSSSSTELGGDQLREQIMSLNLDVAVSWIGPHLPKFITDRTERHEPTLFFNWIPNTLTATGNYTRIYFPSCKTGGVVLNDAGGPAGGCDFEVNQLSKFIWVRMKTHTPEAYHVITSMEFTQEEYEKLLRLNLELNPKYVDNSTYYDETACAWVKSNREKWTQWMPQNLSSKTKIYLGGMFPETGPYWRQPGIAPGKLTPTCNLAPLLLNYQQGLKWRWKQ